MNFLQISLTSSCNRNCWHCPMTEFRNTDDEEYHLTNDILIPYLQQFVQPNKWLIELTGGEPTLYDGFDELIEWLSKNNYSVHIRSNGLIPIKKLSGIKRIIAFHDKENPPLVFDEILIVDKIDSEYKIAYCERYDFPYKVIGKDKENPDGAIHSFEYIAYIEPTCHQTRCPASQPTPIIKNDVDITRMDQLRFIASKCCPHCKAAIDAWRFI